MDCDRQFLQIITALGCLMQDISVRAREMQTCKTSDVLHDPHEVWVFGISVKTKVLQTPFFSPVEQAIKPGSLVLIERLDVDHKILKVRHEVNSCDNPGG